MNSEPSELSLRTKLIALAAIIVGIVGVKAIYAHLVYGDWTCAISNCVKVQEVSR